MSRRLACIALTAVASSLAGAASAQSLPNRDDPAWAPIGSTDDGAEYYILPSREARANGVTSVMVRATVAPSPSGDPNTVVARLVVDCAASAIGVGTAEFYNETEGFMRTVEGEADPVPTPAAEPGQRLVIRHVCAADGA